MTLPLPGSTAGSGTGGGGAGGGGAGRAGAVVGRAGPVGRRALGWRGGVTTGGRAVVVGAAAGRGGMGRGGVGGVSRAGAVGAGCWANTGIASTHTLNRPALNKCRRDNAEAMMDITLPCAFPANRVKSMLGEAG